MDKLNPPSNLVQFKTASQHNVTQSRDDLHKLERLEVASEAAIKTFEACVDFGKTDTTALLATVSEYLAGLDQAMLERVTGLREGILLKTKFLPTVADFHALVKELEAKDNQFISHTHYHKLESFDVEQPPLDRRKQVVMETLGYNPQDRKGRGLEPEYAMALDPRIVAAVSASYDDAMARKKSA